MIRTTSERSLAATRALMSPSLPRPLPGSRLVGPDQWFVPMAPADVLEGYGEGSAALPDGASVHRESETVLRVDSPLRTSAVLVTEVDGGCVCTIVGSPTLLVEGGGVVPDLEAFVRVGGALFDTSGMGFMAEVEIEQVPWTVAVLPGSAADPAATLRLYLAPRPLPPSTELDLDLGDVELQGPCQASREGRFSVVTGTIEGRTVHVRARITDALGSIQPVPPATLAVSKKWGRHRSRPRLTGTGFQPGEDVAIALGDRAMSGTTADRSGRFVKGLQVPTDVPLGHTEFWATGSESGSVATVPYEVRPPK